MKIFIIFPTQLFEETIEILDNYDKIIIIEEPHYFSSNEIKPNKIKIAYLRACMRLYYNNLKKIKNKTKIIYVPFKNEINYKFLFNNDELFSFHLNDFKLRDKLKKNGIIINEIEDTPMFLMSINDLNNYNKRKTPSHATFYEMVKEKLGVLVGVKNQDIYNRLNPKTIIQFDNHNPNLINNDNYDDYYKEAINYSKKTIFKNNIGSIPTLDILKNYPISSQLSYKSFIYFLDNHLKNFGLFQDVIQDSNPFIYHSIISPMLNIGIITPMRLLQILKTYKDKVSLNTFEGYMRQLIGWREYMRYLYLYKHKELIKSNSFNNKKILDKGWYNGTTGILVIDNEIKKSLIYGYSHHIIRLMIYLNFMILNEIKPEDIYKWFMEVVCMDAYGWVMIPNIYSMGNFSKVGMRRPYLSSSNYIIKLSNYKKDGKWDIIWDNKFREFVKSRKIYFYLRSIK